MERIAILAPSLLLLVALWWRTVRLRSAHRRIDEQAKEIIELRNTINELRDQVEAIDKEHPFHRMRKLHG